MGGGTQGSSQPSLKSVEQYNGRQVSGSGLPKSDSQITSLNGYSVRPVQTDGLNGWTGGWSVSTDETRSAKEDAGAVGTGSWAAAGRAIASPRSQANAPTACITRAGEMQAILHLPLGQAAVADCTWTSGADDGLYGSGAV